MSLNISYTDSTAMTGYSTKHCDFVVCYKKRMYGSMRFNCLQRK